MDLADLHIFRSVVHAGGVTRAAVKAVRPRQHWPAPDRSVPAKPQQVGKGLTDKHAA